MVNFEIMFLISQKKTYNVAPDFNRLDKAVLMIKMS